MDSRDRGAQRDDLTEEVEESLHALLDAHPELTEETVYEVYHAECETFGDLFLDDTPRSKVREMALHQTEQRVEDGDLAEDR